MLDFLPPPQVDYQQWLAALKKELKTEDLSRVLTRPMSEAGYFPILCTEGQASVLPLAWHVPALSYTALEKVTAKQIQQQYTQGIRDFYLDQKYLQLTDHEFEQYLAQLVGQIPQGANLLVTGNAPQPFFSQVPPLVHGQDIVSLGGDSVQELAMVLTRTYDYLIKQQKMPWGVVISSDREFFKTVAKTRALRILIAGLAQQMDVNCDDVKIILKVSLREWTIFDSTNNLFRNSTAVAAGMLSGVYAVESLPYDILYRTHSTVSEQADRLALTTPLILQSESFLGEVADPALGSFSLEQLTGKFTELAWQAFQELNGRTNVQIWKEKIKAASEQLVSKMRKRQLVLAGCNDYANAAERVSLKSTELVDFGFRLASEFENLRLTAQEFTKPPKIVVVVYGDYAALQARLNFCKNYFELLGLTVSESGALIDKTAALNFAKQSTADILVWCTSDDKVPELELVGKRCYVAGKQTLTGAYNIYAGQDVVLVLNDLCQWWRSV